MKSKFAFATLIAVIATVGALIFNGARAIASPESDKAEIIALNQKFNDAFSKKDIDATMSCYLDNADAIYYEDTTPFEIHGKAALRKLDEDFFASASKVDAQVKDIQVIVGGDVAAAFYTAPTTWTDKDGDHSEVGRYTQVLKKVNGKWLIWHEHVSVPYDQATGKALLNAKP
jgi:uncharacterized protein (TIGR02246 family)